MNFLPRRIKHVMKAANIATVATTMITGFLGKKETGSAASPFDAVSQVLFGEKTASKGSADAKHTAVGAGVNAVAMYAWSAVLEGVFGPWVRRADDVGNGGSTYVRAAVAGATVSALAFVTDSYVLPKQVSPGFEKRLSPAALATTYGVLAASLAAGAIWANRAEA